MRVYHEFHWAMLVHFMTNWMFEEGNKIGEKLSRNGCEIYQKKIKTNFPVGNCVRMCDAKGAFYALGEIKEYPEGSAVKAIKLFDL